MDIGYRLLGLWRVKMVLDALRKMLLNTVKSFARAVNAKDSYTLRHSEQVTRFSLMIYRELDSPEICEDDIRYAGLLHDVGKIAIRDTLLTKPEKLSPEEMAVMKTHPLQGARILELISQMEKVVDTVKHHHERFDGLGYPEGLTGDQIPLGARIVAIADTYDAMTSDRPYRKRLTHETAVAEIRKNAGFQFDPSLVDVFLKIESDINKTGSETGPEQPLN